MWLLFWQLLERFGQLITSGYTGSHRECNMVQYIHDRYPLTTKTWPKMELLMLWLLFTFVPYLPKVCLWWRHMYLLQNYCRIRGPALPDQRVQEFLPQRWRLPDWRRVVRALVQMSKSILRWSVSISVSEIKVKTDWSRCTTIMQFIALLKDPYWLRFANINRQQMRSTKFFAIRLTPDLKSDQLRFDCN